MNIVTLAQFVLKNQNENMQIVAVRRSCLCLLGLLDEINVCDYEANVDFRLLFILRQ